MMTAKISEIFQSIQGEGKYAGVRQVFVRFFSCNMRCVWCDTPVSMGEGNSNYQELDLQDVFSRVSALWKNCHSVSLTGGEPLVQTHFIENLLPLMKRAGMPVFLETNGILYQQFQRIVDDVDIIAMDIKLPSSTQDRAYWQEQEEFLKMAVAKDVFIKIVVSTRALKADILKAVDLVAGVSRDIPVIIQPNYYDMPTDFPKSNGTLRQSVSRPPFPKRRGSISCTEINNVVISKCLEFQEVCLSRLKDVRVLPQTHKWMNLR
ncbi:MAG: hypothetical protein A2Z81_04420 [Omnitrophica WOR_2 bacterium GWA2_45_18]|nr:MAG: hypothetical protein A2Z81_04420 [Omnitrophica WOR_2 bacterium GWA2_45_18]